MKTNRGTMSLTDKVEWWQQRRYILFPFDYKKKSFQPFQSFVNLFMGYVISHRCSLLKLTKKSVTLKIKFRSCFGDQ